MIFFILRSLVSITTILCLGTDLGGSIFAYAGSFVVIGTLNSIMTKTQRFANATGDKSSEDIATFCFILSILLLVVSIVLVA